MEQIELVCKGKDVLGVRASVLRTQDLEAVEHVNRWMVTVGKPSKALQASRDLLILASSDAAPLGDGAA